MRHLEIIAHTGCEGTRHNSLESCYAGFKAGASIIEVDVRETKDHVAVLLHDDDPLLQEKTYAELISAGWQLEKLETVLASFKRKPVAFNLDLKKTEAAEAAMFAIVSTGTWAQVWFTGATQRAEQSAYAGRVMWNLPDCGPDMSEEQYRTVVSEWIGHAARSGFRGINAQYESCRPFLVEQTRGLGLKVWIYTLPNRADLFDRYARMEVDAISVYEVTEFAEHRRRWLDRPSSCEGGPE